MPTESEVVEQCTSGDIKLVRILYIDSAGIARGRAVPASDIETVLAEGVNFARAQQSFTVLEYPVPGTEVSSPTGEVRLKPDPDTFQVLPYADRAATMLGTFETLDGDPWAVGTRAVFKRVLADLDYQPTAAFESEFYLGRETNTGLVPFDGSGCFTADGMQSAHDIVLQMIDALEAQGMDLTTYYPEYGPGQQEIVIRHSQGLQPADNYVLYKQTIKAIAGANDAVATFLPKPFNDQPGSGCHLHLSLWDGDDNTFFDSNSDSRYGLSTKARSFVAGILDHGSALLALTAPTVVSYKRLQPHMWASAYVCWGRDNREAMIRIPSSKASDRASSTRIEYKPIDNTVNPYLALAGILAAGRDGLDRELNPGDPVERDPDSLSESERTDRSIERYPETLAEALDALADNEVLREALGDPIVDSYVTIKRAQWKEYNSSLSDWEEEHLRGRY